MLTFLLGFLAGALCGMLLYGARVGAAASRRSDAANC
jgi:hypothetical protein